MASISNLLTQPVKHQNFESQKHPDLSRSFVLATFGVANALVAYVYFAIPPPSREAVNDFLTGQQL